MTPTPTPLPPALFADEFDKAVQIIQAAQNASNNATTTSVFWLIALAAVVVAFAVLVVAFARRDRKSTDDRMGDALAALAKLNEREQDRLDRMERRLEEQDNRWLKSTEDGNAKHIEALTTFSDVNTRVVDTQEEQVNLLKEIQKTNQALVTDGSEPTQKILKRVNEIFDLMNDLKDDILKLKAYPALVEFEKSVKTAEDKRKTDTGRIPVISPAPIAPEATQS